MSQQPTFSLEDTSDPEAVRTIREGLFEFNRAQVGDDDYRPLNVMLHRADSTLGGGLLGNTYWGWLYVSILWLAEDLRHQGHGRRLLAMAEGEAIRRGCRHAHLDTLSFQALPFYQQQGYTIFGVLEDLPAGHGRYFLKKTLTPPT